MSTPRQVSHINGRTRAVPAPPAVTQAHARIVEALRDPFAFAVAQLVDATSQKSRVLPGGSSAGSSAPGISLFNEHTPRGNNHDA